MNWRSVGINTSIIVLFFIIYILSSGIFIGIIGGADISDSNNNLNYNQLSLSSHVFGVMRDAIAGAIGVYAAFHMLRVILRETPKKLVGWTFVIVIAANYGLHFLFFSEMTDWTTWQGLAQSIAASLAAWVQFRLPPLKPRSIPNVERQIAP